jgi:hypothetical protein
MIIKTAAWSAPLPDGHMRISISRGPPRGIGGYRRYPALAPGPWFKSVPPGDYLARYAKQLGELDPTQVAADINALAGDQVAVLCCFESIMRIHFGGEWCHRWACSFWRALSAGLDIHCR